MADFVYSYANRFVESQAGYRAENSYALGLAAKLAYYDPDVARTIATLWGFDGTRFLVLEKTGTNGFVAENSKMKLLAFRGTSSLKDWGYNLDADPTQGPCGMVHDGFRRALNAVWDQTLEQKLLAPGDQRPLWITGHSLGGALARLAAARLACERSYVAHGVVTFGQPRVGKQDFVDAWEQKLGSRTFRYVNDQDVAPSVPLHAMGYRHEPHRYFFDAQGKMTEEGDAM